MNNVGKFFHLITIDIFRTGMIKFRIPQTNQVTWDDTTAAIDQIKISYVRTMKIMK